MNITISKNDRQIGPYTVWEVNRRLREGELKPDDMAWMEGTKDWVPLRNIEGIYDTGSSAPVAVPVVPRIPEDAPVMPVVVKPQILDTPSGEAVAKKRFKWIMIGIAIVIVVGICNSLDADKDIGSLFGLGLIGFAVWFFYKKGKLKAATQQEPMSQPVRQQTQLVMSDGALYIEGQIIRLIGVSGLAKGACAIRFESSHASLCLAHGKTLTLPYGDIQLLQIGGRGRLSESVNGAFVGGGFGLGGAVEGIAEATLLNAAVSALTRKKRVECELLLKWTTGELLMLNQEHTPEIVSHELQPILEKIA